MSGAIEAAIEVIMDSGAEKIVDGVVDAVVDAVSHPYYPLDSNIVGYVANDMDAFAILSIFCGSVFALGLGTWLLARTMNANLRTRDQWLAIWFVISGAIHIFVEGYFSINHRAMPEQGDYLGQGWKEYSKSDSRYMTQDPFVVCMESITAFTWGPLSLWCTWMIITSSPFRHPIQALISTGQFYGLILYFATNWMDDVYSNIQYSRPEAYYYYGYYILLNGPWLIVPVYAWWTSMMEVAAAFNKLKELKATGFANGPAKVNGRAN